MITLVVVLKQERLGACETRWLAKAQVGNKQVVEVGRTLKLAMKNMANRLSQ